MADIVVKVSAELLEKKALEIQEQINGIKVDWECIRQLMERTRNYWEGNASDLYQQYKEYVWEDAVLAIKNVEKYQEELMSIAGIYQKAEERAFEIVNALPENLII